MSLLFDNIDNDEPHTRVKICGITRLEDALSAAKLGANAIGFVFYKKSPRYIENEVAAGICKKLPPEITKVGLFVDATDEEIMSTLDDVNIDVIQFHGEESPARCRQFGKPYIKAIRMKEDVNIPELITDYHDAAALLLDTYVKGIEGGTGEVFEWQRIPADLQKPIILAGGLNENNVGEAIKSVSPFAVDVSGGVEMEKGIKDAAKIKEFIKEVMHARQ